MAFPADFDAFVRGFIFKHECAYAPGHDGDLNFVVIENVSFDNGGLTKYGIDAASHPGINITSLEADGAEAIYWEDFFASQSPVFPGRLAYYHFDCAVNLGATAAIKILQTALGTSVDGILGPQTLLTAWLAWQTAPNTLISSMLDARAAHYRMLVQLNSSQSIFLNGWLNRVSDLRAWQWPA